MVAKDQTPTRPRPPSFETPSLDKELDDLGIKLCYRQQLPGRAKSDVLMDMQSFDPTSFRSIHPPADPKSVMLPIAICYKVWRWDVPLQEWVVDERYKWFMCTLDQLCILTRKVSPTECNFFAVMLNGHALHTIFDLDGKVDRWAHLKGREDDVMAAMMHWYAKFFEMTVGRAPDLNHAYWELSCSEKKPISLHLHNVGEVFRSKRDHLEFVLRFRDYLDEQKDCILVKSDATLDKNANDRCLIDKSVYTQNRSMRMVYSCKPDGVNLVPLNQALSTAEALWASSPSYSMPTDDKLYFAFSTYTRTDDNGRECKPKKTARARSVARETSSIVRFLKRSRPAEDESPEL